MLVLWYHMILNHAIYNSFDINADMTYRKTSNISRALVCNKIVDHSDVVGASSYLT